MPGSTIRTHLEANAQLLGFALNAADVAAPLTLEEAVKQARDHALAALRELDEAGTTVTFYDYGELPHEVYRLVPDPVGERDAKEPDPKETS